ncbi:MAG TPA: IPT/TIG domain-containing protein [Verrucomicrobiae bacterium]|nr:IPT/TIG domain-containing protein [Verrucomicrobiae bacterium]
MWALVLFGQNPPPTLTSISPTSGPSNGGTAVTLSGANFLSGATVAFGSAPATNVVVVNSGQITATTPSNAVGTVNVTVMNPDGQTSVLTPLGNPGYEAGNSGWQFAGTGTYNIVTNSAQAHSGQSFAQVSSGTGNHPYLSGILSAGSVYLPVNPGDVITFGGWAARVSGDGTVHWVLQVTDANKANAVYATTTNVTSSAWTFYQTSYTIPSTGHYVRFYCEIYSNTVAAVANFDDAILIDTPKSNTFTYQSPPTLSWIGPSSGPANTATSVRIVGTNFVSGAAVKIGGVAATGVKVNSSTTIVAQTPASAAGAGSVVVTNPNGASSTPALTYTFNPPPTLSGISPAVGPLTGGASVTIAGANFLPGAKVTLAGTPAWNVIANSTSISATTPAHAAGLADLVVINPDGQFATATGAYSYQQPAPVVSSVSPASGSTNGGTIVVVSGTNFLPAPTVAFGGVPAAVTSASANSITVSAPAFSTTGPADVTVSNSDSQFSTLSGGFNYVTPGPTPTVSSISSASGATAGGASVTINGSNFVAGATVMFGSAAATNVTVASSSAITATTPPHPEGRVNVTVTNPDGQSATLYGLISLLPNPSFEGSPAWKFVGAGSGVVVNDPTNAEDGNNYALLTSAAGGPAVYYATDSSGTNQYFPVSAGDVITYGGGAFRLSGDGQCNYTLVVTDASKNVLTTWRTTPINATTQVWTNMQGTYTIPAGAVYIRLGAQIRSNTVTAQVRFDNASFQREPAGAGYTYVGPDSAGIYTYRYDNMRSGVNSSETTLTPANVTQQTFGKKFSYPVDGWIDAQPLYVANVMMGGNLHNVVYVATEHDSVYAFDADGLQSTALWQTSFLNPSQQVTTIPTSDLVVAGIPQPEFGVMATPVIDPVAGTIYVLARTKEDGKYVQRLHALDITTGAERQNSPVLVQASVPGTGAGSVNGVLAYNAYSQNVRPALALVNGTVYFASASLEDLYAYHGWVLGYDSQSLKLLGVFCTTPAGSRGGIWQSGGGIAADAAGNLYLQTGNGTFNANFGGADYGNSILKLQLSSTGLNPVDYFAPHDQSVLAQQDLDIASGSALLLPDQPAPHVHELIGGGKQGTLYVLDRDAMGAFNSAGDSQIVQDLPGALTPTTDTVDAGLWNTPVYWDNLVYVLGRNDVMKAFTLQNGALFGPVFTGTTKFFLTNPVITSSGTANGILWVAQNDQNTIHAYDPFDLTREYYNTNQAGTRDVPGTLTRFMVPTVVNGKLYVGTKQELDVYGLF